MNGFRVWIDSLDRLNVEAGSMSLHSFAGWGHALTYGFLIGAALLLAGAFLAGIRHLATR